MRTTLNIDDLLFHDLMTFTKAKTKTEAVRTALKDYLNMKRKQNILAMRGKLDIEDNWLELRNREISESGENLDE